MKDFCRRHPTIRYHRNTLNRGIAENLSFALAQPSADLIARVDSDDRMEPEFVATLAALMSEYPQAGYGHADVCEIDSNGAPTRMRRLHRSAAYETPEESLRRNAQGYRVAADCILFRAQALKQANYYRPNSSWKSAEDWDLSIRMAILGWGNVYAAAPLACYRVWDDSDLARFRRRVPEIECVTRVYKDTLEPEYIRRGWSTRVLRTNMRRRAVAYADALDSPLIGPAECEIYKARLRELGDSPSLSLAIFLAEKGFNPLLRRARRAEIRIKDFVKSVLRRLRRSGRVGREPAPSARGEAEADSSSETTVSGAPASSAGVEMWATSGLRVLLSHPTGNQNVRNALLSFAERWMLAEFWTTLAWNPESKWDRLLPAGIRSQLAKRAFPEAPAGRVHCVPSREIVRLAVRGSFLDGLICSGERFFSINGMYRHFDGKVARRLGKTRLDAVYAYEGGARGTFREAKRRGVAAFYELPSSHWYWERRLLSEEAERNPAFANLLPKLNDSSGHMQWKDEELELADFVFVPSEHVRRTLQGVVPDEKIRVVNYGAPPVRPRQPDSNPTPGPLRVLFVGALSQRKGIGYLLDAVEMLDSRVQLTLVGGRIAANPRVDAACARWRWFASLSHAEVLRRMQESDVLVLPSLAEGCALVVLEALACGLPVVVTPNTGAMEFVSDGAEGFVVPICRADAIADRLSQLDSDRQLLAAMSRNAQAAAAAKSWKSYRRNLADAVGAELCR